MISELLDLTRHHVAAFDCGESELTTWLRQHAEHADRMNTARTFVWTAAAHADEGTVVGYYALAAHLIEREAMPARVGRGGPRQHPAILLAKLAVDKTLQGQGLGTQLLIDALRRAVEASQRGPAARVIVVDALHDRAAEFYRRYGFIPLPDKPLTLVQKLSDVEAAVVKR